MTTTSTETKNVQHVRLEDTLYKFLEREQEQEQELELKQELKLKTSDFKLAGLGQAGENCGKIVMTDIDIGEKEDDIRGVKFKPLRCSRIECPSCYYEWAIRQSFWITLKIEALAEIREERPFHVVFSVHPLVCYGMTWTDINQKIWRRGRRRLSYVRCTQYYEKLEGKGSAGHYVKNCPNCLDLTTQQFAGIGIFHPFRIRKRWKRRLGGSEDEELDGTAKLWKKIRERLLAGLGTLEDYVEIGYHAHNLLFTDHPELQKDEEYLIKFTRNFERLDREEVIALARYLITHTATIEETTIYRNHVCEYCGHSYRTNQYRCNSCGRREIEETHVERNRIVHPIRSFGILHNFNPKKALIEKFGEEEGLKIYHRLAHEIAQSLFLRNEEGELITMEWNEEEEELEYPASTEEFVTMDEKANWVSIYKVIELLRDIEFREGLSPEKLDFAESVVDYVYEKGIPPPLEVCSRDFCAGGIYVPDCVSVVIPISNEGEFDLELEHSRLARKEEREDLTGVGLLRQEIIDLLAEGENDIFALDICLADYDLGEILRVLEWMAERGEVIMLGELVELNMPAASTYHRQVSLGSVGL